MLPVSPSPYSAIESVSLSGPCFVWLEATECRPALLLSSLLWRCGLRVFAFITRCLGRQAARAFGVLRVSQGGSVSQSIRGWVHSARERRSKSGI